MSLARQLKEVLISLLFAKLAFGFFLTSLGHALACGGWQPLRSTRLPRRGQCHLLARVDRRGPDVQVRVCYGPSPGQRRHLDATAAPALPGSASAGRCPPTTIVPTPHGAFGAAPWTPEPRHWRARSHRLPRPTSKTKVPQCHSAKQTKTFFAKVRVALFGFGLPLSIWPHPK